MKCRVAVLAAFALTVLPLHAQTNELGLWAATSKVGDTSDEGATIDFDNGKGFGVSVNHFFTDRNSIEFSATPLSQDGQINIQGLSFDIGSLDIIPIVGTVQWHAARRSRVSPYFGFGVAYVMADDLESDELNDVGIGSVEVDSKVTWAAQVGLDIGIGSQYAIGIDAKYIAYTPGSRAAGEEESVDLDLNPLVFSAGFKFRW